MVCVAHNTRGGLWGFDAYAAAEHRWPTSPDVCEQHVGAGCRCTLNAHGRGLLTQFMLDRTEHTNALWLATLVRGVSGWTQQAGALLSPALKGCCSCCATGGPPDNSATRHDSLEMN